MAARPRLSSQGSNGDIIESSTWPQTRHAGAGATYELLALPREEDALGEESGHDSSNDGNGFDEYGENEQQTQSIPLQHVAYPSRIKLVNPPADAYRFKRYFARASLNTLGPLFITGLYAYTVFGYLLNPSVNDIVPSHLIDPKVLFYTWIILSIFLLDWAKSGLAGFEAAALMKPSLAPANAMQLMWHLDRGWGSLSGWWNAAGTTYNYAAKGLGRGRQRASLHWRGPGILWLYLAMSSLLFYIAVPLAGISMDPKDSFKLSKRQVVVIGVNESTFDVQTNAAVQALASNSWRTGRPATPQSPAIFYAQEGAKNVSSTFYEDFVEDIYWKDISGQDVADRMVSFFSGPPVAERAHGKAWGLLSGVSCSATSLDQLKLIRNVTGLNTWTTELGTKASTYQPYLNKSSIEMYSFAGTGLYPVFWFADKAFGVEFQFVIATDTEWAPGNGHYSNTDIYALPNEGSFEIVVWQSVSQGFDPDDSFRNMTTDPLVTLFDNDTISCYGVRCIVQSDVGYAELDAAKRTFSDFEQVPAQNGPQSLTALYNAGITLPQWPGIFSLQSIVFGALSTATMGYLGPPSCLPGQDPTCNAFYGANLATGGVPKVAHFDSFGTGTVLQVPGITPERMALAMYKIFGESAAAMMAIGPTNWTGTLQGLDPANDLVPGKVPWQVVLALLCLWCAMTVIPQFWTFAEPRWSSTLEAFEMFRFGAEWREAVQRFTSNEFQKNDVLLDVPGMVGDGSPNARAGFIGLSRVLAQKNRLYAKTRDEKG